MTCYDIPRGNGKSLEDIIEDFSKIMLDHAKAKCDPYTIQVGDITPRLRPVLEDLRALRNAMWEVEE